MHIINSKNGSPELVTLLIHVNYWMHVSNAHFTALSMHETFPGCNLIL